MINPVYYIDYFKSFHHREIHERMLKHWLMGWMIVTKGKMQGTSFPIFWGYNILSHYPNWPESKRDTFDIIVNDSGIADQIEHYIRPRHTSCINPRIYFSDEDYHHPQATPLPHRTVLEFSHSSMVYIPLYDESFPCTRIRHFLDSRRPLMPDDRYPLLPELGRSTSESQYICGGPPSLAAVIDTAYPLNYSEWDRGWLVEVEGPTPGVAFTLRYGRNPIHLDIQLEKNSQYEQQKNQAPFTCYMRENCTCRLIQNPELACDIRLNHARCPLDVQLKHGDLIQINNSIILRYVSLLA